MKIYFKENTHQYFNEEEKQYISVSALVSKFKPKKDWAAIKRKYAAKNNLTVDQVTEKWEKAKKLGTNAGTIYHAQREQELLDQPQTYNNVVCSKKSCSYEDGMKVSIPIEKLDDNTVYPELMIYDHKYAICGQSDKVVVSKGKLHVIDYKTDKSIERKAFSSEWVKPEHFLEPVSHLEVCNYNEYSLKMSIYMYMLWKQNKHLKIGDLLLEHVTLQRDSDGIPVMLDNKPVVINHETIEVPYLKKEAKDIFEYYRKGEK